MGEIMERAFSFIWLFAALTLLGACVENPPPIDPLAQPENEYGTTGGYLTEETGEGESDEVPLPEEEGEEGVPTQIAAASGRLSGAPTSRGRSDSRSV